MNGKNCPFIYFLPAKNAREKLSSICEIVHYHFTKKLHILIAVPNGEAAQFLTHFLWKYPEESFIPHIWTESPTKECVAITLSKDNLNQASALLNLCPAVHPQWGIFPRIYDLFDETDQEKERASQSRKTYYAENGCQIAFGKPD